MNKQPKLNLKPANGIKAYDLPDPLCRLFPKHSANEEDCVPIAEQTPSVKQTHAVKPRSKSATSNIVPLF